ncbi:MAG: class I tRNA ligase family protein, partial [Desulfobacteraceae bacterium]|nr:class I tRNA ligase family protein [Desulfobacteraceae bacterium]
IECSAMSYEYLGKGFDIHGGGKDLIFPHHENEIAQSEAAFGGQFVKYWIHNGFVDINNEKMSKSLGNFTMIKEVLGTYSPEVIRMFLLSKHYRSPIDYSQDSMREMNLGLDRIYAFLERLENAGADREVDANGPLWEDFSAALNDDFNSAKGLASVFEAVKKGNKLLDDAKDHPGAEDLKTLTAVYNDIRAIANILAIFSLKPSDYFAAKKEKGMADSAMDAEKIEDLIQQRTQARKDKDFSRADEIRDLLADSGITLKDGPEGTTWEIS